MVAFAERHSFRLSSPNYGRTTYKVVKLNLLLYNSVSNPELSCNLILTNLFPMLDCNSVAIPDTQNIVLIISLNTKLLLLTHKGPARMKGIATVEPNIVMYC